MFRVTAHATRIVRCHCAHLILPLRSPISPFDIKSTLRNYSEPPIRRLSPFYRLGNLPLQPRPILFDSHSASAVSPGCHTGSEWIRLAFPPSAPSHHICSKVVPRSIGAVRSTNCRSGGVLQRGRVRPLNGSVVRRLESLEGGKYASAITAILSFSSSLPSVGNWEEKSSPSGESTANGPSRHRNSQLRCSTTRFRIRPVLGASHRSEAHASANLAEGRQGRAGRPLKATKDCVQGRRWRRCRRRYQGVLPAIGGAAL